jgi:hypothetical protein
MLYHQSVKNKQAVTFHLSNPKIIHIVVHVLDCEFVISTSFLDVAVGSSSSTVLGEEYAEISMADAGQFRAHLKLIAATCLRTELCN